jgi:hypothetical protein
MINFSFCIDYSNTLNISITYILSIVNKITFMIIITTIIYIVIYICFTCWIRYISFKIVSTVVLSDLLVFDDFYPIFFYDLFCYVHHSYFLNAIATCGKLNTIYFFGIEKF